MIKLRRILLLIGSALLLSGCKYAILNPKGIIAASERNLLIEAVLLMLIVVIPVIILSFVFAYRYRSRNKKLNYDPKFYHSNAIEIVCWTVPCIIIAVLATMTWFSTHKLDPYRPLDVKGKPIIIQAVALNWRWLFIYPNSDIATINYIKVPVDTPVRFQVTSDAPMNSIEIPQIAGQIYAMAGMRTKLNVLATEKGVYDGMSTNFSGDGFSGMRFKMYVTSKQDYEAWLRKMAQEPKHLTQARYDELAKWTEDERVQYFSHVKKNLFNDIIMKYMGKDMPNMKP